MDEMTEADRIERDLARTRARMDSRLDELQDHLTPKQMLNDAFSYFRGGEGASFTNELIGKAKANPIPVALTGIGIAWLMASGQQPAQGTSSRPTSPKPTPYGDDFETRMRLAEGSVQRSAHDDDDSYASRVDDARGKVLGVVRNASDTAASYSTRIKDALASAMQHVRETAHDLTAKTGTALEQLGNRAGSQGTKIQEGTQAMAHSTRNALSSVTSNPFALGAIAALVGVLAGSLIPTFDQEEHPLGSVAKKVRTAGRDLAQDVVDRGGHIANDALNAVKDSAAAHGLTSDKPIGEMIGDVKSGALAANVKQVAQETLQAGKDSVQTHIAGTGQN